MHVKKELYALTGLRFVAALYVFLFHVQMRWPITNIPFFKKILDEGAVGMSVFFMLSGYLLMMNYVNLSGGVKEYFVNRFARIYPVYFLAGLVTLPWLGISFGDSFQDNILSFFKLCFIFFANIFVIQAWFPQLFSHWNNGGSWSISVEVFCYALLPLLLPYLNRLSARGLVVLVCSCYLFSVMAGLSVKLYEGYGVPVFYAMPIFRLPEFLIGACLYLFIRKHPVPGFFWVVQIASALLLLGYLGTVGGWMPIYIGHNWIVLPVVAITIAALSTGKGPVSALLSSPVFVWFGKVSYCFYSFQSLIILSLIAYHDRVVELLPVLGNGKVLVVVTFVCLTVVSAIGYYLVEEPARRIIKSRRFASPGPIVSAPNVS